MYRRDLESNSEVFVEYNRIQKAMASERLAKIALKKKDKKVSKKSAGT